MKALKILDIVYLKAIFRYPDRLVMRVFVSLGGAVFE
jgi:hypothetical protein